MVEQRTVNAQVVALKIRVRFPSEGFFNLAKGPQHARYRL